MELEKLRKDLIDYFGTAMIYNPMAMMDLEKVREASEEELIDIAMDNKFNLNKYKVKVR